MIIQLDKLVGPKVDRSSHEALIAAFAGLDDESRRAVPDFLVIAPAKTGTTWLAKHLAKNPRIYCPFQKELEFFTFNVHVFGLDWYLNFFRGYEDSIKGEVTPSYALLPLERIELIRQCMPHVKLIFLMREPIARTWSECRHWFTYLDEDRDVDRKPLSVIMESVFSHSALYSCDYQMILERWLRFFRKDQILVAFSDEIADDPKRLLAKVFRFLGTHMPEGFERSSSLRARENAGPDAEMPPIPFEALVTLYKYRVRELDEYLESTFGVRVPRRWFDLYSSVAGKPFTFVCNEQSEFDVHIHAGWFWALPKGTDPSWVRPDELLNKGVAFRGRSLYEVQHVVNHTWDHSERMFEMAMAPGYKREGPWLVEGGYLDYNIMLFKDEFWGLWTTIGDYNLREADLKDVEDRINRGLIVRAATLGELKLKIKQLYPFGSKRLAWHIEPSVPVAAKKSPPSLVDEVGTVGVSKVDA